MRLCLSRREAILGPSWMLSLVRELGDVSYARVNEARISRWVILLGVLASCRKVGEARPNQVELERARHVKDSVPPLVLLISYTVTFCSTNTLRIYLTGFCVTGHGHMPCRRRAVIGGSLKVSKRHIGRRSFRSNVILDRAGGVEGLMLKAFVSCSSSLSGAPLPLFVR